MARETILVVEDEEDICELVAYNLEKEGYKVMRAGSAEEGMALLGKRLPDLVLLDLMLPGMDGLSLCREIRRDTRTRQIPVIMLTAKGEEVDVVTGLEVGADDYICKPFSPRVLVARIKAVLRRQKSEDAGDGKIVERGDIRIDPVRHEVLVAGKPLALTYTEFRLLQTLARRPGVVFTRYQIVDAVRGEDYAVTDRSVDVQVVGLRKKLGRHSKVIETVRGVGYRFRSEG